MASMRDIKRRKSSITSTQQITKAMKLVSTVKLQKARAHAEATDPYFNYMYRTVSSMLAKSGNLEHPYLKAGEETTKRSCLLRKVATGKHSLLLYLMEDVSEYILIFLLLIILILHLVLGNANMLLIRRLLKSICVKRAWMNRTKIMYGLPTL